MPAPTNRGQTGTSLDFHGKGGIDPVLEPADAEQVCGERSALGFKKVPIRVVINSVSDQNDRKQIARCSSLFEVFGRHAYFGS